MLLLHSSSAKDRQPCRSVCFHHLNIRLHFTLLFLLLITLFTCQETVSLKILPKPCSNALGEQGTCMFVWECIKTEGRHLGTCVDGFLFGSCCAHNETANQLDSGITKPEDIENIFSSTTSVIENNALKPAKPSTNKPLPIFSVDNAWNSISSFTSPNKPFNTNSVMVNSSSSNEVINWSNNFPSTTNTNRPSMHFTTHNQPVSTSSTISSQKPHSQVTSQTKPSLLLSTSTNSALASSVFSFNPFKPSSSRPPVIHLHNSSNHLPPSSVFPSGLSSSNVVSSPMHSHPLLHGHTHTNSTHTIVNHHNWNRPWHVKPPLSHPWHVTTSTTTSPSSTKPSSGILHTFRPPIFNLFRPSPATITHGNTFRPNFRPTSAPVLPANQNAYSTRTTPFSTLSTMSMTTESTPAISGSLIHPPSVNKPSYPFPGPISPSVPPPIVSLPPPPPPFGNSPNYPPTNNQNISSDTPAAASNQMVSHATVDSHKVQCGTPQIHAQTKVVGGKNSAFGAWPWQVSVRRTSFFGFSSTHRCGGAILNNQWIATAGHCVDDLLISQIRIRVGEYDFSSVMEPYPFVERTVRKKVVHPQYNFFTYENDLALVQLEEPLVFQPHIAPICLPEESVQLLGRNATVTGWGRLSEGGILPSVLQEVKVPIVSNDKCKSMFLNAGRHEYIPEIFMCAGFEEGGRDSCQGDSGGPLQVRGDNGKWFLAGIISWGIGCAEPNLPGVCTRISKFRNWITSTIN